MRIIDVLISVSMVLFACICFYLLLVWMPVHVFHEIECLENGYPETKTTITLKGYCTNFDGAVTKKVVPI